VTAGGIPCSTPASKPTSGADPQHRDAVPLIYFFGVDTVEYLPKWPVYVVAADPLGLTFSVSIDDMAAVGTATMQPATAVNEARRQYVTTETL